jgi:hypothetical protein
MKMFVEIASKIPVRTYQKHVGNLRYAVRKCESREGRYSCYDSQKITIIESITFGETGIYKGQKCVVTAPQKYVIVTREHGIWTRSKRIRTKRHVIVTTGKGHLEHDADIRNVTFIYRKGEKNNIFFFQTVSFRRRTRC